jgi:hypothetical protein
MSDIDSTNKLLKLIKHSYLSTEIKKGKVTSWISLGASYILNYHLYTNLEMNIFKSTFISIFIFGNILSFCLDMMLAKKKIRLPMYKGTKDYYGPVPYREYWYRGEFMLRSLLSPIFIQFMILGIIDTIINLSLLKFIIKLSDKYSILNKWKHRKVVFAALTSSLTFGLFINQLRFQWAYEENSNFVFDMLMYIWFTLILLIVVGIEDNIIEINDDKKETTTGNILWV